MKISIKTLSGELFQIDAEGTDQIIALKNKIQEVKSELVAERQKLIHAGKVLKDTQTVTEIGLSESDFIVCMVTKEPPKKAVPAPTPAPVVPTVSEKPAVSAATTTAPVPSNNTPAPANNLNSQFATPESIQSLAALGYPENECRAALIAAMGNPNLAYDFLQTGVPDTLQSKALVPQTKEGSASDLEQLRTHPQFNMLKQLIQQNPASLPQVLNVIGQQNLALLETIHSNEAAFIAMMNEPITNTPAPPATATATRNPMAGGMPSPASMVQMLSTMPAEQREAFAASIGMTTAQLDAFTAMMSQMPASEFQNMLGGEAANRPDPPGVIRLTADEMQAVTRLSALGFSPQQAAQAYIACDKDESLAANLLFDNMFGDEDAMYEHEYDGGHDDDDV